MEEILPAARLLSRATAVTPSDYDRAKTLFLAGLHNAGMQAQVSIPLLHLPEACASNACASACKKPNLSFTCFAVCECKQIHTQNMDKTNCLVKAYAALLALTLASADVP